MRVGVEATTVEGAFDVVERLHRRREIVYAHI